MEKKVMGEPLIWVVVPIAEELFIKYVEKFAPGETDDVRRMTVFDYLKKGRLKPRKYKGIIYFLGVDVVRKMSAVEKKSREKILKANVVEKE